MNKRGAGATNPFHRRHNLNQRTGGTNHHQQQHRQSFDIDRDLLDQPRSYSSEACYATISDNPSPEPTPPQQHHRVHFEDKIQELSADSYQNQEDDDPRLRHQHKIHHHRPNLNRRNQQASTHESRSLLQHQTMFKPSSSTTIAENAYLNEHYEQRSPAIRIPPQGVSTTLPRNLKTAKMAMVELTGGGGGGLSRTLDRDRAISPQTDRRECYKSYRSRTLVGDLFRHNLRSQDQRSNSFGANNNLQKTSSPRRNQLDLSSSKRRNQTLPAIVQGSPNRPKTGQTVSGSIGSDPAYIMLAEVPSIQDELYHLVGARLKVINAFPLTFKVAFDGQEYYVPREMARSIDDLTHPHSDVMATNQGSNASDVTNRSTEFYSDTTWCHIDMIAQAQKCFTPIYDGDLPFDVGDVIVIREISPSTQLAKGYNMGQFGKFPINHVRQIPEQKLIGCSAEALFDYDANNSDEISLSKGQRVVILETRLADPGWWRGRIGNRIGVFPAGYVQIFLDDLDNESVLLADDRETDCVAVEEAMEAEIFREDPILNEDNPYPQYGFSLKHHSDATSTSYNNGAPNKETFSDSLMKSSEPCQDDDHNADNDPLDAVAAAQSPEIDGGQQKSTKMVRKQQVQRKQQTNEPKDLESKRRKKKKDDDTTARLAKAEDEILALKKEIETIKSTIVSIRNNYQSQIDELKLQLETNTKDEENQTTISSPISSEDSGDDDDEEEQEIDDE